MNDTRRLVVSIDDQTLRLIKDGASIREFPVSTAIKGMGFVKDSYRTPVGNFRICEKIGADQPSGTIFKARVPVGQWHEGESPEADLVLTRILRLDGIDPANANTLERCIYIHGTNREDLIGQTAGHGCVRLRNADMIALFDMVEENDLLEILPATRRRGKLMFISFGSLLDPHDGSGEKARPRSEDVCSVALAPWASEFITAAKADGWLPVLLADSPAQHVSEVARELGVTHYETPPLDFHHEGSCAGSGGGYPMIGCFQQSAVIRDWLVSFLPEMVAVMTDPAVDQEMKSMADVIITPDLICDHRHDGFAGLLKIPSGNPDLIEPRL
jgi:hypothetical protein